MTTLRCVVANVAGVAIAVAGAGCSSPGSPPVVKVSEAPDEVIVETAAPQPRHGDTLELTTRYRTLIIDDGERPPQLCVGVVATSLPPQCAGVNLIGWDWDAVAGTFEEQGAVRWGDYFVDGEYSRDDNTLKVARVTADGPDVGLGWEHWRCEDGPVRAEGVPPADTKTVMSYIEDDMGVAVFIGGSDQPCDVISVLVAYDDGSTQAELDDVFGAGAVRVASALSLRE